MSESSDTTGGNQHRGAIANPANRFERTHRESDPELSAEDWAGEDPLPRTEFLADATQKILSENDSPDVGFRFSVNPYRGCEHGCIYCYARPTHEYLGWGAGIDFESRILVKHRAPELLRAALASTKWRPEVVAMSGVTDAYQPVERRLKLTRRCLEVFEEFRNPVAIVTKNALIARDVDVLSRLAKVGAAAVYVSVTSLDSELRSKLEPRTSPPAARLGAIRRLREAGVPVGVMVAPIIPGLNDMEIPAILEAAAGAGAQFAGRVVLRLPLAVAPLFEDWLQRHYPDRKEKVLSRIRSVRGGALNNAEFGTRMRGEGIFAEQIHRMFDVMRRKFRLDAAPPELSTRAFRRVEAGQGELFG